MRTRDLSEEKGIWIPKKLYFDKRLTPLEKFILIEIDSLDGKDGCCASNRYLANFCQCSVPKITQTIKKLSDLGYIEVTYVRGNSNGTDRIVRVVADLDSDEETEVKKMAGAKRGRPRKYVGEALLEEKRLKYNQYHREYYHRKKAEMRKYNREYQREYYKRKIAEKKAKLERLVKQNLEIKIEGGNE